MRRLNTLHLNFTLQVIILGWYLVPTKCINKCVNLINDVLVHVGLSSDPMKFNLRLLVN
jgi:hypothetical protein